MRKRHYLLALLAGSVCGFAASALPADSSEKLQALSAKLENTPWQNQTLACAILPPLSPYRHLPDEFPADGKYDNKLSIVMAPNEIGHASFLILPFRQEDDVNITVSALRGDKQTIPASATDLRIVKYWYQDGTAWNSYFADPLQQELVPELLVHDEKLLKVDHEKKYNYLRVGNSYQWMSYPETIQYGQFNHIMAPVKDADKLAAFSLTPEENKKFFLTIRLPKGTATGNYTGTLTIHTPKQILGTLSLSVRVLPFELPDPMTWYNPNKRFLAAIRMPKLTDDFLMANQDFTVLEKYRRRIYTSMFEHNMVYPLVDGKNTGKLMPETAEKLFRENLKWMKECGFPTDMLLGGVRGFSWNLLYQSPEKRPPEFEKRFFQAMEQDLQIIREIMGKDIIVYPEGWNEPSMKILQAQRPTWEKIHGYGMKIQTSGKNKHLQYGGYNEDLINTPGNPSMESARIWHAMDNRITNYANPHTGPENPDYMRRTHGINLYKADYDGTCNYHFLENSSGNIWRDTNSTFRTFAFVYPTSDGILDTLQYEGFRAGIDDIRYATKLRNLATQAIQLKGTKAYYAGKIALRFLALAPVERMDLETLRLEMIEHILNLRDAIAATSSNKDR